MKNRLPSLPLPLIALAAGALNVLAFAPYDIWPLQIATLALLFALQQRAASVRQSALLGWAYGFGWAVCCIYWPYISMHRYGGMPAWMAGLAVLLLGLLLGAFAGAGMAGAAWLKQRWSAAQGVSLLLLLPAAWTLSEWLRGWVLTGFPWAASGYAHSASPLAGFAPIVGVYGLAWLAAASAGALAWLPSNKLPALLAVAVFGAGLGLRTIDWTESNGHPIAVRLLQGNVPQDMKFESEQLNATLAMYYELIRQEPADLIATPETAFPLSAQQLPPDYLPLLADFAQQSHSALALGILVNDAPLQYTNSVLVLAPDAAAARPYRYDKHHLVPFGEFIPTGFRWFVDMMRIPLGDQTRGAPLQRPFMVRDQRILPNICYEDLFGEEIAQQLAAGLSSGVPPANILLNVSNIGWFGDTIVVPQHLQISQMRALETGRPVLRATNTGATAVIDPKGRVVAQLAPYRRDVLTATVQGYRGTTPYIRLGNAPAVTWALLMLGLARLARRRRHALE